MAMRIPSKLSHVKAIAGGAGHSLALRDTARPSVKITSPKKAGKSPSSRKIQIQGKVTDNLELVRWQYKLNKGKGKNGGSLSGMSATWKKRLGKVKVGKNTMQVRVYDGVGLVSKPQKRTVLLRQ